MDRRRQEKTRLASMHWLSMLLEKMPAKLLEHLSKVRHRGRQLLQSLWVIPTASCKADTLLPMSKIFPALLGTLSDLSDKVVKRDLEVLAQISRHEKHFPECVLGPGGCTASVAIPIATC